MPTPAAVSSEPRQPTAGAGLAWFVQTAGRVWGPYAPARVAGFVAEGRLTPQCLLATQAEGPFHPADRWRAMAPLFQASPLQATSAEIAPRPSVTHASALTRPLLVWAELASLRADRFEALAAQYGDVVAIRPDLWLVQARCDAAALRNALSRRLTGADALMIVHAPLDQAAWFNLDSAAERRLRQVWGG